MKKILCNVLVSLAWPGAAFAADTTERSSLLIGLLVPLLAVSACLLAMLWWLKRGKTLGGSGPVKLVQAVAVGARERVVVLDAQGRRLLIGVTSNKIELLAELHAIDTSPPGG
ncbi:FliO/MopB family protein [Dyella acidiphila]|uniref:Flagellar biosynthetic protein FliO n=1 Tax=Dyella acidiphila TaxID=2775866 RepID=A0ABR9GBK3_9GAMM|nr:flagellar biosynthetic protein FliO [Dyella acidiphila]MBE1161420.1 flagellar biosynthetic protein FliO [Dyella acidiphila]